MSGNILNSNGVHVAVVNNGGVFDLDGRKLYDLKGINIYRLSGELVGHLNNGQGTKKGLTADLAETTRLTSELTSFVAG